MIRWIRLHPFIFITVLGIAALVYWGLMNSRGYCWDEARYMSEDELIDFAILASTNSVFFEEIFEERISNNNSLIFVPKFAGAEYRDFINKKIFDFKIENPDCCRIITNWKQWKDEGWFLPSAWGRFTGSQRATVEINYIGKRQNSVSHDTAAPRAIYRTVGNCGQIYKFY